MSSLKCSVSPIIYNNGDRNTTNKIDLKEVVKMVNIKGLKDEELNKLILSDDELVNNILASILTNSQEQDNFSYNDYNFNLTLIQENHKGIKDKLLPLLNNMICNSLIDDTINFYSDLMTYEAKQIVYGLSRLLFLQDKYKDDRIGQEIDKQINEWLEYIKTVNYDDLVKELENYKDSKLLPKETYKRFNAYDFKQKVAQATYNIYNSTIKDKPFLDIFNSESNTKEAVKGYFKTLITQLTKDAENYNRYSNKFIHYFINDLTSNVQFDLFENAHEKEIKELKDKVNNNEIKGNSKLNIKDSIDITSLYNDGLYTSNESKTFVESDEYINKLYKLYQEYQKTNEYKYTEETNQDIIKWREKAEKVIKKIESLKKEPNKDEIGLNYLLEQLAYSDYQTKTYKIILDESQVKRNITNKELKEKYQDITQLNGKVLDDKKGWGIVDTSKQNNTIINMRETIGKKIDSDVELTQRKINKLREKTRPTKTEQEEIKELEEQKREQLKALQDAKKEADEIQDDINLLQVHINDTSDGNEIKRLIKKRSKMEKLRDEKKAQLGNNGVYFQMNTEGKLVYEKTNKKTKESYKLMINADYDIQNFNKEGRNFLQYIPNIDNVVNQLNETYITIDLDDYVDFYGISNPRRTRQRLLKTLTEMRKESYEYSYIDEKGALQEGSLILIADVMTTEYKGKNTLKVQLGGQFKKNIQQAIIKGQIAHVKRDVFKLGRGKNKREYMAKELYLYFVRLARTEAKKGLIKGVKYSKALKVSTILDYLIEINLIKYDLARYSEKVKDPLQTALYMGQELGLFEIETDAFKYYDDIIGTLNNGANVKDKVPNFENQLIEISLYSNMIDLEGNKKAHETYKNNRKKHNKKSN